MSGDEPGCGVGHRMSRLRFDVAFAEKEKVLWDLVM
jgi:hypothetical protein